jgi:hypothetical protein
LHASNLRNYYALRNLKPAGVDIVIWYFGNEMYLIHSDGDVAFDEGGHLTGYAIKNSKSKTSSWAVVFGKYNLLESGDAFCW